MVQINPGRALITQRITELNSLVKIERFLDELTQNVAIYCITDKPKI